MTLKYESEILFDLMKRDGDDTPSDVLPYESELKEKYLEQVEGAYPKLQDYRSEWLNYNLEAHLPADFPVETLSNVTEATVDNVVPYAYRSAILKGSTKYRDIDTGEFLETFEEGRNLELVSVKMPVLTTTGKNLFNSSLYPEQSNSWTDFIPINRNLGEQIISYQNRSKTPYIRFFDSNKVSLGINENFGYQRVIPTNAHYFKIQNLGSLEDVQLEIGSVATSYDTYKSNILTVNEDVTLRSNGDICDELNLLTGQLTQRIDEDGEVLSQEVVKTVDLSIQDQEGNTLSKIKPIEGTMHIHSEGTPLKPTISMEIPVEATTQNLASFIKEE